MKYINQINQLEKNIENIEKQKYIAIDTEFIREYTYFSKLCLIQIATDNEIYIIDNIALNGQLEAFQQILKNDNIKKVFHSCRQDLEIFYHLFGELPQNIADTQILAMACGYAEQSSYSKLVKAILGIELAKTSQMSQWDARPLSPSQLKYAELDVEYLRKIYHIIAQKMQKLGRQNWCEQEMQNLLDVKNIYCNPDCAYKKIKLKTHSPIAQETLKQIASWREKQAIKQNKPRKYIMTNDVIKALCQHLPTDEGELNKIRIYGKNLKRQSYINDVFAIIKDVKTRKSEIKQNKSDKIILNKEVKNNSNTKSSSLVSELAMLLLKKIARDAKVTIGLLASPEEIREFIKDPSSQSRISSGWRRDLLYEPLMSFLQGQLSLLYKNGDIAFVEHQNDEQVGEITTTTPDVPR